MDSKAKFRLLIAYIIIANVTTSVLSVKRDPLVNATCVQKRSSFSGVFMYKCNNLQTLQKYLDKAQTTTTAIVIQNSNIQKIPGHAFIRFISTLKTIDLHLCGIEAVDLLAFNGLSDLEELILWGNKLNWVAANWFTNLQNLRVLDLSFNRIQNIEYQVYRMLPNLERYYIDYNQLKTVPFNLFSFFPKLKKVKFGMNPLNWAFRVHLTWQLIYQKVDYQDDWENWDWFSDVVRECVETGQGSIPSDQVLECVTVKLVEFVNDKLFDSNDEAMRTPCSREVSSLLRCTNTSASQNRGEGMRKALQGLDKIIPHMEFSLGKFNTL